MPLQFDGFDLEDDYYDAVPSLKMTSAADGKADVLRNYSQALDATASLSAAVVSNSFPVPAMSDYNQKGIAADYLDILKPDTAAPGELHLTIALDSLNSFKLKV